jgi:hypothetical protein
MSHIFFSAVVALVASQCLFLFFGSSDLVCFEVAVGTSKDF